ncbi:hypothetical protein [Treponema sp. OMZ 787]|uniref:hypothetical protein n=1 Tax=Treponema sp. OMZ 787 TaxID=2563669 RepID=UPI0020A3F2AD|nr:hypothetical protein [Treponema sp. OMZ 787]
MEAINYARGGSNMVLPADAQIVQGVSGNAVYFPAGVGVIPPSENRTEITISVWRQWDGVVDSAAYRGIFETANIKVYFDQETDLLTVEIAGIKTVTDIKDDQEQTHWCFLFAKNRFFKIYKNAELKAEMTAGNYPVDFSEGFKLGGGRTHATFDELRIYKKVATEPEIRGLYVLITRGTQVQHLETLIANNTPKYLGVVQTVPSTRMAIITKGEKLGAVDANPGDWVLSGKTIGGWKVGVCYRWTGAQWKALEPEANYTNEYQACLLHMFEIEELRQQTGHFGALFAKVLVAQKAMIDELTTNQAFIKKLVVQKLRIDSIQGENQDFEVDINEDIGISVRNEGKVIFEVSKTGQAMFAGDIITPPFELIQGVITPYSLTYNNELLAEIIRGSKFAKNNTIPFLGSFLCGGTYQNKNVKRIEVYLKKESGNKTYYDKYVNVHYWRGSFFYKKGNVSYKTTKYILNIFFEDGDKVEILEELVEKGTKNITTTSKEMRWPDGYLYEFEASDSDVFPSVRVNSLIISVNNNATTMRLKGIPLGDGAYKVGTIYDEDGFLKIKR